MTSSDESQDDECAAAQLGIIYILLQNGAPIGGATRGSLMLWILQITVKAALKRFTYGSLFNNGSSRHFRLFYRQVRLTNYVQDELVAFSSLHFPSDVLSRWLTQGA
jgi:hypothetical protein